MKATIDGITYEGTEEEIRRIAASPPTRAGRAGINTSDMTWPLDMADYRRHCMRNYLMGEPERIGMTMKADDGMNPREADSQPLPERREEHDA